MNQEATQDVAQEEEPDVTVYLYDNGSGPTRVQPGKVVVPLGASIGWENLTGCSVRLLFPDSSIFEEDVKWLDVEAGQKSQILRVREDVPRRGGYPYVAVVTCSEEAARFAVGGSHPDMIIV